MTTEVPPPPLPTPPAELPPMHALRKLVEAFGRNDHDMITVRTPRNGTRIVMPKYMGTLRALCVREICRNLTVDNFFSTIDFTLGRSNDAFLCRWLLDFGVRNFDQLLLKPGWAAFFEQQAALCLAMIKRAHYHE
ncbi:hypothetical protein M3Y99_00524900 [Aphelenchoides fujianensis]|nr:hypothetical protein M3Y99_00524900 [Aphelenchoides fujianensis]